ncbi:MAG: hypothetical protein MMC33_007105 [Icmadophila ericetorum]|nr:hypothetical protein [Icmadophila ericetorum]
MDSKQLETFVSGLLFGLTLTILIERLGFSFVPSVYNAIVYYANADGHTLGIQRPKQPPVCDLPTELLLMIVDDLPPSSIACLSLTCERMREIFGDKSRRMLQPENDIARKVFIELLSLDLPLQLPCLYCLKLHPSKSRYPHYEKPGRSIPEAYFGLNDLLYIIFHATQLAMKAHRAGREIPRSQRLNGLRAIHAGQPVKRAEPLETAPEGLNLWKATATTKAVHNRFLTKEITVVNIDMPLMLLKRTNMSAVLEIRDTSLSKRLLASVLCI